MITSWPLTKAYPGIEYNIRLGVVGGRYPYQFALTQSPPGMVIDADRGEVTWTPSANQNGRSFDITVTVTDALAQQVTQSYTLQVTQNGFYFVSASGSDASGNGSFTSPWRTIEYAIDQGTTNDILYIRSGTYSGKPNMDPGNINKWIAYPGDTMPVIDLQRTGIHFDDDYSYFDGLEVINAKRWAFGAGKNSHSVFRRNHMHHLYDNSKSENPCFIWFMASTVSNNVIIQDNVFHDLFDRGIEGDPSADYHGAAVILYDTAYLLFEDNEVYNIDGRGFNDKRRGNRTTVRGNKLHGDFYYEAVALGGTSNGEVSYNVMENEVQQVQKRLALNMGSSNFVHHNTLVGSASGWDSKFVDNIVFSEEVRINNSCSDATNQNTFDYNVYWSNANYFCGLPWKQTITFQDWQGYGHDQNTMVQQPQFVNASLNVYRPTEGSFLCTAGHDKNGVGAIPCGAAGKAPPKPPTILN